MRAHEETTTMYENANGTISLDEETMTRYFANSAKVDPKDRLFTGRFDIDLGTFYARGWFAIFTAATLLALTVKLINTLPAISL